MHDELDYIAHMRERGFRVTPQRKLILDTICECGGHATAGEIYERVRCHMPTLNQATVYRVLDFFCALNLVAKTEIDGRCVYEIVGETPHHHLVCRRCGNVDLLADHHFDELAEHLLREHRFKVEVNHLAITGLCAECAAEIGT